MANKLEKARQIINETDAQMAELFIKRMEAVKAVFEYKKEFGLPIYDKKREASVIEANSALIEDEATVKTFYKEKGHFRLQPENDALEPIIVNEVIILGKVVASYRYY